MPNRSQPGRLAEYNITPEYTAIVYLVGNTAFAETFNGESIVFPNTTHTTVIQAALSYIQTRGGTLKILKGNYSITVMLQGLGDDISVDAELGTIFTVSGNRTVLKWGDGTYNGGAGTQYDNVTISNLEINLSANSGNDVYGIWLHTVSNAKVISCHVHNQATSGVRAGGIVLDQCVGGVIENNHVHETINGIVVRHGCQGITVKGNHSHDTNNYDCITTFQSAGNNQIIANYCHDAADNGILVDGSSAGRNPDTTVSGNTVHDCTNEGIETFASHRTTITGNTSHDNGGQGISVLSCGDDSSHSVTGNISYLNGENGYYVFQSRFGTVAGNTSRENTLSGIYLDTTCTSNVVSGNTVYLNQQNGIVIDATAYVTCTGNNLRDNGQATTDTYTDIKLVTTSTNNIISGNTCRAAATNKVKYNIEEAAAADTNNSITDNLLVGGVTATGLVSATTSIWRDNKGFVTENAGTGTINSGATTAVVTHGLSYTPVAAEISIVFTEDPTVDPSFWWITTITSTQFTLNVNVDPTVSNLDFGWAVRRV